MPHFEVHTLAEDRWLIDGIFVDKETAVEDAKVLLQRQRALDAVRVLRVEERPDGFAEATVFIGARPRRPRRRRRGGPAAQSGAATTLPPPPPRPAPLPPPARPPSAAPALLLLLVLSLAGVTMLYAHEGEQPRWVWVFDRPEAWQPHTLHNPWHGAVPP